MLDHHFVLLGAFFSLAGGLSYVVSTLKGKARPNLVSYVLWTLAPMIAVAGELQEGIGLQVLMTFMVGFMPLLVVLAAFVSRKATWKLTKFDLFCGFLSIVGLVLWLVTSKGNIAIFFSILADGLAALPTIVKSYSFPETEDWANYLGGLLNALITLLTIDQWSFASYGFPIYIFLICLILVVLIRLKPQKSHATAVG